MQGKSILQKNRRSERGFQVRAKDSDVAGESTPRMLVTLSAIEPDVARHLLAKERGLLFLASGFSSPIYN